jgi:hypothetical protein
MTMNGDDLKCLPKTGWIGYLEGENPDYPVTALQAELVTVRQKVEKSKALRSTAKPCLWGMRSLRYASTRDAALRCRSR